MTDIGCGKKNPLIRDGKSQEQRTLEELSTTYVGIDERTPAELLRFARDFARQVRYYDTTNAPNGDWTQFIEDDISTRIALISLTDPSPDKESFREMADVLEADLLEFAPIDRDDIWLGQLQETFAFLIEIFDEIKLWLSSTEDNSSLHTTIKNLVKSRLRRQLSKLIGYHKGAATKYGWSLNLPSVYSNFSDDWMDPQVGAAANWTDYLALIADNTLAYGSEPDTASEMDAIAYRLRILFNNVHEARVKIIAESEAYLSETLDEWPSHNPHMALFLTFLLLFKYAQDSINTLVDTHLNFYFSEVLRMEPNPPVEDSVYLVFQLAKNTTRLLLEDGELLKAGKDGIGKEMLYSLDEDTVFNKAIATDFRTIYRDPEDFDRLFAAPVANSGDGEGGDFVNEDEPSWPTFGNRELPYADVGFAFASPALKLAEGERDIVLTVLFEQTSFEEGDQLRSDFITDNELVGAMATNDEPDFKVYVTGEKGWIELTEVDITLPTSQHSLVFSVSLPEDFPAITNYSEEVHKAGLTTNFPVIKAVLNMTELVNSYGMYRQMKVEQISVEADVRGVKNVVVANDNSVLNASKTFSPLGATPGTGSRFMVGSNEVFAKTLDNLKVNIEWSKLPTLFDSYYSEYSPTVSPAITLENVVATVELLEGRKWKKLRHKIGNGTYENVSLKLFKSNSLLDGVNTTWSNNADGAVTYDFDVIQYDEGGSSAKFERDVDMESFVDYNVSINRGFMRLTLGNRDLGHSVFNRLYTDRVIALSKWEQNSQDPKPVLPNEPYTPEIKGISIDYSTSEKLVLGGADTALILDYEDRVEQFFHLHPFGMEEVHPETYFPSFDSEDQSIYFMPQFDGVGALFMGIEGLDLNDSNSLSLLVRIAEGTASPDLPQALKLDWSYLRGNRWVGLTEFQIPTDSTFNFRETGIISFLVPTDADTEHTILPSGKVWLRAHPSNDEDANNGYQTFSGEVAKTIGLHAQAARATFNNNGNDPQHLAEPLVAETISKLKVKKAEVKSIKQPYASFGGKMEEDSAEYYRRVSERLRHKDRAVTIWDYETMVLQEFPSIYKVRCINHTKKGSELAPGHVYVVLVPSQVNQNTVDQLQPRASVSTIESITEYLKGKISPFVKLKVANPTYERIQVKFDLYLMPGRDTGLYKTKVIEDIKAWLSPWAFKDGVEISFEGRIHRSVILNFVEELEYVDYVENFQLYHYPDPSTEVAVEVVEAFATTPMSILVSHADHLPTVYEPVATAKEEVTDEC